MVLAAPDEPIAEEAMDTKAASSSSLSEDKKQFTRSHIRRAAMEVVARRGFDATVEEIAEVSGVSARTIFRHYANHDPNWFSPR